MSLDSTSKTSVDPHPTMIRVLLVDDHEMVRRGTRDLLDLAPDIQVIGEAGDGGEAIAVASRMRPDVILMDVALPGANGIAATREIKRTMPRVAILALSAYDDPAYVHALLDEGVAGYILKSIRGPALIEAVRAVRDGESVIDPALTAVAARRAAGRIEERPLDPGLTPREIEVLRLAAGGLTNRGIANRLSISARTVQVHLIHIFQKLDVGSRTEAIVRGLKVGLLDLTDLPDHV